MPVRGIRGATSVEADVPEQILAATRELLEELLRTNAITAFDEIVSAIFTTSPDLVSTYPAEAARGIGMTQVPLLCASTPTGSSQRSFTSISATQNVFGPTWSALSSWHLAARRYLKDRPEVAF